MNHSDCPHPHRAPWLLACLLVLAPLSALAQFESSDGRLRLSGFGTLGAATAHVKGPAVFSLPGRQDGVDDDLNLKLDTKLAVQGRYKLSDSVTATTQIISKHNADGDFRPDPEWAFLRWDLDPAWSLRAGRMGAPTFMISDARDVNYSQLTARPPMDVYGQVPVSRFEGGDLTYRFDVADAAVQTTVWGGRAKAKYTSTAPGDQTTATYRLDRLVGLNATATLDNGVSLRAGSVWARLSIDTRLSQDLGGLPSVVAQALTDFNRPDARVRFSGLGASYDRGHWLLNAEHTRRQGDGSVPDTTGWYVNAGYRIGAFIPYLGWSQVKVDDPNRTNPFQAALGQPSALGALAGEVQRFLNGLQVTQKTLTLGTRWDVADKVALKFQWDRIHKPAGSFGWFYVPLDASAAASQDFFDAASHADVLSVTMDFIF
jgi:hypothetical protein